MRMRKLLGVLAAGVLATALATSGALSQAAPQGNEPAVKPAPRGLQVTVKGKVARSYNKRGYVLQGKPEVYLIANPNPEVLDALVKSGEPITVEARTSGDFLTIQTINGKKYEGTPAPPVK
jgi:hypothetical protein